MKNKYLFLDNGIRNAVIYQFNPLNTRNDIGQLWENFILTERLKQRSYENIYAASYFWRTYGGQEIDLIEERGGKLYAFECKWGRSKKVKTPPDWKKNYPDASFLLITPENYLDLLTPKPGS